MNITSPTAPNKSPENSNTPENMLARASARIGFISGPLEVPVEYFTTYYVPLIERGMSLGHNFILGPSCGIDSMAFQYLVSTPQRRYPATRVAVYLSQNEAPRLWPKYNWFEKIGGTIVVAGRNHTARDGAMTRASHYDILRYRTEEESRVLYGADYRARVSGTEKNELRRKTGIGLVWREVVEETVAVGVASTASTSAEDKKRRNLERKVKEATRFKECIARGDTLEANQMAKVEKYEVWLKELKELEAIGNEV